MSASALPLKIIYDTGGNPSGLGEFVVGTDHIASTMIAVSALSSMSDVSAGLLPTTNEVLAWNGSRWTASTVTIPGAGSVALSGLTDVSSVLLPQTNEVLAWTGAVWTASTVTIPISENTDTSTLSSLGDTNFLVASEGQVLTWHGADWRPSSVTVHTTVSALTDVALDSRPAEGDTLMWSGTGDQWVASSILQEYSKSFSISGAPALGSADEFDFFRTEKAITITRVVSVVGGVGASGTYQIKHHTDRSNAGNNLFSTAQGENTNSTTTGDEVTSFGDATIPSDSFVWVETSASGGSITRWGVTVYYTVD